MTYPSNSADGQVRAFIDRILRMKEEEKAIKDDIKEIYAEAKANGFDKTQLGRAVTIVQKRQKDGDAVDEADAILDLYLAAYYGTGTRVATHTHAHEDHDPETGEVLDTSSDANDVVPAPQAEPERVHALVEETADEAEPTQVEASSVNPRRVMSMTPLEPRTAGGLKGFGFTVKFEDSSQPQDASGPVAYVAAGNGANEGGENVADEAHSGEAAEDLQASPASYINPDCAKPDTCQFASKSYLCSGCNSVRAERLVAQRRGKA